METEMDWKAQLELSNPGQADAQAQAALIESTFGNTIRTVQTSGNLYMVFPEQKKYVNLSVFSLEGEEAIMFNPMEGLRCVQETPQIRLALEEGEETLAVDSLSPIAEQVYFSLDGFEAMSLIEFANAFGSFGMMGGEPVAPTRPGPFGRPFRFF